MIRFGTGLCGVACQNGPAGEHASFAAPKGQRPRVLKTIPWDELWKAKVSLFPVPEGRGPLIHWGKPVSGLCSSGAQHFAQLDHLSPGHIPFDAPVAWKNGVWNFALPWSFDSNKELDEQVRSLVGQLKTGLDDQARGAVIFFAPTDTRARVLKELSYVESLVEGTRKSELLLRDGVPDTTALEAMIQSDVFGV